MSSVLFGTVIFIGSFRDACVVISPRKRGRFKMSSSSDCDLAGPRRPNTQAHRGVGAGGHQRYTPLLNAAAQGSYRR